MTELRQQLAKERSVRMMLEEQVRRSRSPGFRNRTFPERNKLHSCLASYQGITF